AVRWPAAERGDLSRARLDLRDQVAGRREDLLSGARDVHGRSDRIGCRVGSSARRSKSASRACLPAWACRCSRTRGAACRTWEGLRTSSSGPRTLLPFPILLPSTRSNSPPTASAAYAAAAD